MCGIGIKNNWTAPSRSANKFPKWSLRPPSAGRVVPLVEPVPVFGWSEYRKLKNALKCNRGTLLHFSGNRSTNGLFTVVSAYTTVTGETVLKFPKMTPQLCIKAFIYNWNVHEKALCSRKSANSLLRITRCILKVLEETLEKAIMRSFSSWKVPSRTRWTLIGPMLPFILKDL